MTQHARPDVSDTGPAGTWRRFVAAFAIAALTSAAALWLFVVWLDPYGLRTRPGRPPTPIMDLNQRFMYPQLARSGRFDAAVFGTSTVRLLDPTTLDRLFGARFANFGLNAGTPWEQVQLARLFLRQVPRLKMVIFGLDSTWCAADADAPGKRLTFRAFPEWLYDDDDTGDVLHVFTARALEIAARVALHRLDLMPERIRGDGYEVFVPPDARYDLTRARAHLREPGRVGEEAVATSAEGAAPTSFPALRWLDDLLGELPAGTNVILVFPPVHIAAQPASGSSAAMRDQACKDEVAALGTRRGAAVVDFRVPSEVTTNDANYWDRLHFRVGIAERFASALKVAHDTARGDDSGFYRVLSARAPQ
ncbi:MAG TPA: hypothetical protein VE686_05630 [Beijerinckiaceae bacterium]|jgi:hypothetical protein|nr:hypothetical protein [Beijerinckiaceae bacterium]